MKALQDRESGGFGNILELGDIELKKSFDYDVEPFTLRERPSKPSCHNR